MLHIPVLLLALLAGNRVAVPAVTNYVESPALAIGESVRAITLKLGEPENITFELVPNIHDPKMRDVRVTLQYDGLRIVALVALCCDKSLLESVRVSDPKWAPKLGVEWPSNEAAVRQLLGVADATSGTALRYAVESDVGTDTLTFTVSRGGVSAIEWQYNID
jgi:hypothetical protein